MVSIGNKPLTALVDSGSSDSYISESMAKPLDLHFHPSTQDVSTIFDNIG
jgi:predicted aspartyl protease